MGSPSYVFFLNNVSSAVALLVSASDQRHSGFVGKRLFLIFSKSKNVRRNNLLELKKGFKIRFLNRIVFFLIFVMKIVNRKRNYAVSEDGHWWRWSEAPKYWYLRAFRTIDSKSRAALFRKSPRGKINRQSALWGSKALPAAALPRLNCHK